MLVDCNEISPVVELKSVEVKETGEELGHGLAVLRAELDHALELGNGGKRRSARKERMRERGGERRVSTSEREKSARCHTHTHSHARDEKSSSSSSTSITHTHRERVCEREKESKRERHTYVVFLLRSRNIKIRITQLSIRARGRITHDVARQRFTAARC